MEKFEFFILLGCILVCLYPLASITRKFQYIVEYRKQYQYLCMIFGFMMQGSFVLAAGVYSRVNAIQYFGMIEMGVSMIMYSIALVIVKNGIGKSYKNLNIQTFYTAQLCGTLLAPLLMILYPIYDIYAYGLTLFVIVAWNCILSLKSDIALARHLSSINIDPQHTVVLQVAQSIVIWQRIQICLIIVEFIGFVIVFSSQDILDIDKRMIMYASPPFLSLFIHLVEKRYYCLLFISTQLKKRVY